MTTVYINLNAAVDGDGSIGSPRNIIPTFLSGTKYLFYYDNLIYQQLTVAADGVTLGSYGGGKAKIVGNNTVVYGVYATSVSNLTIQDLEIFGVLNNGVLVENDIASSTETNINCFRLKIYSVADGRVLVRSSEASIRVGTGICIGSGPTVGTSVINGIKIQDCEIYDCAAHGIDVRWRCLNVLRTNNHVYKTGKGVGSHGITSHPIVSTITSGWTLDSGTIYSRARVSTNDSEQLLINTTDQQMLTKVAGTTPASGQWSVDATRIYVNIGGVVTGKSFFLKRQAHGPFIDIGHVVHDVVDYDGNEGHGIDTDDGSGPCTILRCISYNNAGSGFYSFRGQQVTMESCVAYGNIKAGFANLLIDSPKHIHCTSANNKQRGFQWDGGKDGNATNCIALSNNTGGTITSGIGYNVGANHTGFTSAGIAVFNNLGGTEVNNITADFTTDPELTGTFQPKMTSPMLGAGTHIAYFRDLLGRQFYNPPSIGAYEYERPRISRT